MATGLGDPGMGVRKRSKGLPLSIWRKPTQMFHPLDYLDRVEQHRYVLCRFYDSCLDEVCSNNWNGWSCTRCRRFTVYLAVVKAEP